MGDKKFKRSKFEDKSEYKEFRSATRRKAKTNRHKAKNRLHDFTGSSIDEDKYYDIMDDLEHPEWSD
tara:strand:+ start:151 stop:351 length:201 start_codon:yes stop_codon:yes gene_type:complete